MEIFIPFGYLDCDWIPQLALENSFKNMKLKKKELVDFRLINMYNESRIENRIPIFPLNFDKILNFCCIKTHINELIIINLSMLVQGIGKP